MQIFTRTLEDRILLVNAVSAPVAQPAGAPAWVAVANLQTALNSALALARPVFILPCTIPTSALTFAPAAGSPNRLVIQADPGTVIWTLSGSSPHLIRMQGMVDSLFQGIIFDGANQALTEASTVVGLVRFDGATTTNCVVDNCEIRNSTQSGISFSNGARCTLRNSRIYQCSTGAWGLDSTSLIENNSITSCSNNGISIWRSSINGDNSIVINNRIENISNASGGTGQFGNGVSIFRASAVTVQSNQIFTCRYSAVRVNGGGNAIVTGNNCFNLRETAIFIEAPTVNINTNNCIVSNNVINGAGTGISVVNGGLFNDGITRGVIVSGNQVEAITVNPIPDVGYTPPQTSGLGIICETETTITGNYVDTAATGGIVLGTNNSARRVIATGNIVRNSRFGIGFSQNSAAVDLIVSNNIVLGYQVATGTSDARYPTSGAIVPVSFNGTTTTRVTSNTTDYGNFSETRVGSLTVAANRATP